MFSICFLHDKFLFMYTPRYLAQSFWSSSLLLMVMLMFSLYLGFLLVLIRTKLNFLTFSVSLLVFGELLILFRALFSVVQICSGLLWEQKIHVSSLNKFKVISGADKQIYYIQILFTYIKNRNGPSILPCATRLFKQRHKAVKCCASNPIIFKLT